MSSRLVIDNLPRCLATEDNVFVSIQLEGNVRALRRIALLVIRAKEDWGPFCSDLDDIARVIERIKREIALGSRLTADEVGEMASLVTGLSSCSTVEGGPLQRAVVSELRDLVAELSRETEPAERLVTH